MKRNVLQNLIAWKNKPSDKRKPLILEGARQTGKTWLARELGRTEFDEYVEINFEDNEQFRSLFEMDFDIERILMALRSVTGKKILQGKTLIFFDEIQYARRGLLSLKYFGDKAPEYHVIAAGSLLGVVDHKDDSFPVGKVEFERIYPLSYEEFLMALGKDGLVQMLHSMDWDLINSFSSQYIELLRQYYYVGGMPEAVRTFVEEKDYVAVRKVQLGLLESYQKDFSKHPPQEIVKRMILLWNTIPSQLAKENKKFVYTAVRPSARARDFETSIQWLCDAGVAYKVTRVRAGELPLTGFEDADAFKMYVLDVGLHGAMTGLDAKSLISGNEFFKQYKGALTEQFVLQQLVLFDEIKIHYWTPDEGIAEVDFVVQLNGSIVPIEVKAEVNLKAKSLAQFIKRYNTPNVIRTSLEKYFKGEKITNVPLFAIHLLPNMLK
ncbi:MAG: ATP-binding protein [Bacteroidales bacterium]|nr:ATP-binding protein [Bacteroidales bacterium]MBR3919812.1 ATP-binding protein [Clostridia bacterium]